MSKLSLSMIVRDARLDLPACLSSVRGVVDEIVIADTGSTDDTVEIAGSFGARVIQIPWEHDFAGARNRCLAEVTGDWVLVLDADEQLDAGAAKSIRAMMEMPAFAGFQTTIRNYVLRLEDRVWDRGAIPNDGRLPESLVYPGYVEHENVRLFRRSPEIYFVGRVHESVGPRIMETGGKLGFADFFIHHFGMAVDAGRREAKNRFYRDLGRWKVLEMPHNAQAHFELGLVELDNFGNLEEALDLFERAFLLDPKLGIASFFKGLALLRLNRPSLALRALEDAERAGHATALVAEASGDAHYNCGDFRAAIRAYELAIRRSPNNAAFESKLGLSEVRTGQFDSGLRRIRRAIASQPTIPDNHDRLILAMVWLDRIPEASVAAVAKLDAVPTPVATDFLRAASLLARQAQWVRAAHILERGLRSYPEDNTLRQGLAEVSANLSANWIVTDAPSVT